MIKKIKIHAVKFPGARSWWVRHSIQIQIFTINQIQNFPVICQKQPYAKEKEFVKNLLGHLKYKLSYNTNIKVKLLNKR